MSSREPALRRAMGVRRRLTRTGRRLGVVVMIAVLAATGCAAPADVRSEQDLLVPIEQLTAVSGQEGPLLVVATTSIVADVVANVGGDDIQIDTLIPAGAEPHDFNPSPGDLRAVSQASIVFVSGVGLEQSFLSDLAVAAGDRPLVSISEGVQTMGGGASGGGPAIGKAPVDPHVWMDPTNVARWAQNAADGLGRLDPANKAGYRTRAAGYADRVASLDEWIQEQTGRLPAERRLLVTDHYALGYFARRYGFQVLGAVIPSASTLAEPAPQELAALEENMKSHDVRTIFVEAMDAGASLDSIARDVGAEIVQLHIGSLTAANGPAATYIDLMQFDTLRIVEALAP
jgi:manganese/iron transport system substrate-binding protein